MLTGLFVALMAALLPLRVLAELVNIGTLLAFAFVCAAVLMLWLALGSPSTSGRQEEQRHALADPIGGGARGLRRSANPHR